MQEDTRPLAATRAREVRGVLERPRCASCGASVSWRIERFCRNFRPRFGGRTYCMECQRAFPPA